MINYIEINENYKQLVNFLKYLVKNNADTTSKWIVYCFWGKIQHCGYDVEVLNNVWKCLVEECYIYINLKYKEFKPNKYCEIFKKISKYYIDFLCEED